MADGEGGGGGEGAVHVRRAQVQGDGQRGRAPQERFESYKVKYVPTLSLPTLCPRIICKEVHPSFRSWEVDFGYIEGGVKKNALVKVRLCPDCSWKLNYRKKQKEVTKSKEERKKDKKRKREEKETEDERLDEKVAKMKEEEQG